MRGNEFYKRFKEKFSNGKCYVIPPIVAASLITGGSAIAGGLLGKKKKKKIADAQTITQEAMLTPEQEKMRSLLGNLATTGKMGDITLGEGYGGNLGNYNMTGLEEGGQSLMAKMLAGGNPEMFNLGTNELRNILSTDKYDPYGKDSVYSGFKKQVGREMQESQDTLKRNMSMRGGLSSGGMDRESGLLAERGNTALQSKLAELYQDFANRKTNAASTAINAGVSERGMQSNLVNQAMSVGSLDRLLKDQEAKDKIAEWTRARGEKLTQIDTASKLAYNPVQWGAKSFTLPAQYAGEESPWAGVLNQIVGAGANFMGSYYANKNSAPKAVANDNSVWNDLNYNYSNVG